MMHSTEFFCFDTGQASDVGRVRQVNEDSFLSRPESGLWIVADGMGGHAAGDYASQTIVRELMSVGMPGSAEDLMIRFMERLRRANDMIREHAQSLAQGTIGATVVAFLVHGEDYAVIWSGDSRIYRLRGGQLSQLTRDHTEVQALLDAGSISAEEAETWPRKNVITRAIGVTEVPECDVDGSRLEAGDVYLLCSDGLSEHISDAEIAAHMQLTDAQECCDQLIAETLERGAKDNVTVITVRCMAPEPVPEDSPVEALDDMT